MPFRFAGLDQKIWPRLGFGDVHVWHLKLGCPHPFGHGRFGNQDLSCEERIRVATLANSEARDLYRLAHVGLRRVLARYLNADPARLRFERTGNGKPVLVLSGPQRNAGLTFNLSHSGQRVAIAVARHSDVGADVERMRGGPHHSAVARRFFAAEEHDFLIRQTAESQSDAFYRIWTLKEAFLKLTGEGFARRLDSFVVVPDNPCVLLREGARATRHRSLSIDCRYLPDGYVCAVMADRAGLRFNHFAA